MKKYENKQVDGKVNKENKDTTRNLCFHDWLIVRELKVLDDVYDEMLRQVNYRVLDLYDIEDSDERQKKYDKILEERETLRAIYIQRRNELKAGFTDRQEHRDGEVSEKDVNKKGRYPWGPKKQTIEEATSDIRRGGICYADTDEIKTLSKNSLNGRFGCLDESTEFDGDEIVEAVLDEENINEKPSATFVFNKHEELKDGASGGIYSGLTPEMLYGVIHDRLEKEDE